MKKYLILFLLLSLCSSGEETEIKPLETTTSSTIGDQMSDKIYDAQPTMQIDEGKSYTAVIKTNLGDMTVEFFTDDAPITVNNFIY